MDRNRKVLAKIRTNSRILQAIEGGATPGEIKANVHAILSSVVADSSVLDRLTPDILTIEATNVQRVLADPWSANRFQFCLGVYRRALSSNRTQSLDEFVRWDDPINRGLSHYWSTGHLEQPKGSLQLDELSSEVFRNIGALLEGTLQPFLRALLGQVRILRGKDPANIDALEFGNVIQELVDTSGVPDLFKPLPWDVPLNQWRNVAQHHGFEVRSGQVHCWYGKPPKVKYFTLSENDLWTALRHIFKIYFIVRTARAIFLIEVLDEVEHRLTPSGERPDVEVFRFAVAVAEQGFEVVDANLDKSRAFAVLQDVTTGMLSKGRYMPRN